MMSLKLSETRILVGALGKLLPVGFSSNLSSLIFHSRLVGGAAGCALLHVVEKLDFSQPFQNYSMAKILPIERLALGFNILLYVTTRW